MRLKLYELFIKDQESFEKIEENEEFIQRVDYFYKYKFFEEYSLFSISIQTLENSQAKFPNLKTGDHWPHYWAV